MSDGLLDCEVVVTSAGARAMLDRKTGEVMHPGRGPLAEASALYVGPSQLSARLLAGGAAPLVLLDVGLGAGSNAAAAFHAASTGQPARRLEIVSFDRSLEALALAQKEPNREAFGLVAGASKAAALLLSGRTYEDAHVTWRVVLGELPSTLQLQPPAQAEVVFWDPFSPRRNPELWTVRSFEALLVQCAPSATVHTYSSATATRSALLLAGFAVGFGDPAGDKQATTTVASPSVHALARPLDRRWLERLARSSAPFPTDAPADALERIRALPQFA